MASDRERVTRVVQRIIAENLGIIDSKITDDTWTTPISDLGADSLDSVEISQGVSDDLEIFYEMTEVTGDNGESRYPSANEIVDQILTGAVL